MVWGEKLFFYLVLRFSRYALQNLIGSKKKLLSPKSHYSLGIFKGKKKKWSLKTGKLEKDRQEKGVGKSKGKMVHTSFLPRERETGTPLPGALLPKPRCGSRLRVTCTISPSGSAIKLLLLLFRDPRYGNKATHCAFPQNFWEVMWRVWTAFHTHMHGREHNTGHRPRDTHQMSSLGQRRLIQSRGRQVGHALVLHNLLQLFFFCTGLRIRQNLSRGDFADRASQGVQW